MAGRKKTETVEAEVVETAVVPAGKMEFRLINPTEDGFLRRIQWNKEELEAAVRAKIAGYENVVYTEENIKAAKNDRAELNKLIKAIEERRKQVKNIINKPYAVFEAELNEITALINEPVALIDQQVKAFEEKQKKEKTKKNNIFSGLILKLINTDRRIPDIKMPDRICGNKILSRTEIDHVFK